MVTEDTDNGTRVYITLDDIWESHLAEEEFEAEQQKHKESGEIDSYEELYLPDPVYHDNLTFAMQSPWGSLFIMIDDKPIAYEAVGNFFVAWSLSCKYCVNPRTVYEKLRTWELPGIPLPSSYSKDYDTLYNALIEEDEVDCIASCIEGSECLVDAYIFKYEISEKVEELYYLTYNSEREDEFISDTLCDVFGSRNNTAIVPYNELMIVDPQMLNKQQPLKQEQKSILDTSCIREDELKEEIDGPIYNLGKKAADNLEEISIYDTDTRHSCIVGAFKFFLEHLSPTGSRDIAFLAATLEDYAKKVKIAP